nr:plasmid partitioning protein RepB [Aureimonas ureilytica]
MDESAGPAGASSEAASLSPAPPPLPPASGLAQRVGASVIGATQRSIAELREERDRLLRQVESGGAREIDPNLIDPSPFRDRMPEDDEADFVGFRQRFAEEGQRVPAELRRHPDHPGRYQLVYGHRRWRAATDLGVPLRAIVVEKTDAEVAVSQGIENAERQDLSWIERATFAATLERAGLKAREVRAALGIDDPELARFRAVMRVVPEETIRLIGRAPKAGRPRWVELARLATERPARLAQLPEILAAAEASTSDSRLQAALTHLRGEDRPSARTLDLRDVDGRLLARAQLGRGSLHLAADKAAASDWDDFLRDDLAQFARRFREWQSRRIPR